MFRTQFEPSLPARGFNLIKLNRVKKSDGMLSAGSINLKNAGKPENPPAWYTRNQATVTQPK